VEQLAIRPYDRSRDEAAVIDLWHRCDLVVPWNDPGRDIEVKLAFQPELLLVAEREGAVVGSVMAGYEGHRGWINYLAVEPELRRRGVGRRLMEAAEALLRPLGCQKINLMVRTGNRSAVEFYRRLGYSVDDVVGMGKRLG
jgi:ribosomal protein S18 acetylase RimI-like enzyme